MQKMLLFIILLLFSHLSYCQDALLLGYNISTVSKELQNRNNAYDIQHKTVGGEYTITWKTTNGYSQLLQFDATDISYAQFLLPPVSYDDKYSLTNYLTSKYTKVDDNTWATPGVTGATLYINLIVIDNSIWIRYHY
jgi:hypothetical protein